MTRILNLAFTLALLFGIAFLSLVPVGEEAPEKMLTILVGFVLLAASVAGPLAARLRLPKITGFLVVGLLAGPSLLGLIPRQALPRLALIDHFALALIAVLAGGELKIQALRPAFKTILLTTGAVVGLTTVGVAVVFVPVGFFLPFLEGAGWGAVLALGLLLGLWASNSSPDLTVAVIEETGSKGPLTDVILGVTIVKDVVVIVLFTLGLAVLRPALGDGGGTESVGLGVLREVGGALLAGAVLGWLFSLYLGQEGEQPPVATFLFAYVLVVVSDLLHVELLLTGVAAGFVTENLSEAGDEMIRGIEKVSVVIFAFFFTIAGAKLDLEAIGSFWLAALVLLLARLAFTYWGAKGGTRWAGAHAPVRALTWRGLISQGGVTLGLLLLLAESMPEAGEGLLALGMAVVFGNILAGPVLLKTALVQGSAGAPAGEGRGDFGPLLEGAPSNTASGRSAMRRPDSGAS